MDSDDITRENPEDGWYRRKIGRRIELGANRLIGLALGTVGLYALWLAASTGAIALADDWPKLALAAGTLFLSRLCFRARTGIIEGFGEEPTGNEPTPWKRGK